MDETEKLREQVSMLEQRIKALQESIGQWRRKAQGAKVNFSFVSERHENGRHFISISLPVIPADLTIHEVLRFIRQSVIPKYFPYRYGSVYTSKRFNGWVVTLWKEDRSVDMSYIPCVDSLEHGSKDQCEEDDLFS
ncbi:hypothetical protein N6H14_14685 [Paenibacillus sp. CC-CFT747]|nr:hypothetical protein N6H14_14685 [Paenibacillus sp. CC-CFT747]